MKFFEELKGQTLSKVENHNNTQMVFTLMDGSEAMLYHEKDCCENVRIVDIIGNLDDLVGTPILMAEEATSEGQPALNESFTWAFYKLATLKGYVTIRWLGESNGNYSEEVAFKHPNKPTTLNI